jgi:hypothetical protein
MSLHIIPVWRDASGHETGPLYPAAEPGPAVNALIDRGLREAMHAGGTDIRILIMDDLTGSRIATIRPKATKGTQQ